MVGDTLKKAGDSSQNSLVEIRDVGDTQYVYAFLFYFWTCLDFGWYVDVLMEWLIFYY